MQAIEQIAKITGVAPSRLASDAGYNKNYISATKARGSEPSAAILAGIVGAAGYKLYAVPDGEDMPPGALEITSD